jgi:HEAT repeat protein
MPGKLQDIETLFKDLASKDGIKRVTARDGLVEIGKPAVKTLIGGLQDKNQTVRWESAKALGLIADPSAVEALVAALKDKLFDVRWLAAEGLVSIGKDSVKPVLKKLMENPQSEFYMEGAHHVFHGLKNDEYADILKPLLDALSNPTLNPDIPIRAQKALKELK